MNDSVNPALPNIRTKRIEMGLAQEELARRAGCSTSTVRLIEGGWRASPDMVTKITAALEETAKERSM